MRLDDNLSIEKKSLSILLFCNLQFNVWNNYELRLHNNCILLRTRRTLNTLRTVAI